MGINDPCMANLPLATRNYILGCFATTLANGNTILGGHIRYRTIRKYLKAATDLFRARQVQHTGENITDYISLILSTARKYEEVPKRRLMITDDMMAHLITMSDREDDTSILPAIVDWIIL